MNLIKNNLPVALITGSSRGIGQAIAHELAANKFLVIINNFNNQKEGIAAANMLKNQGFSCLYIKANVANENAVKKMMQKIISRFGRIDLLVNNAGILLDSIIVKTLLTKWQKTLDINLTSAFLCSKYVFPIMQNQKQGKIINISSVIGQIGNFGQVSYSASKGGLIALTKSLAKEGAKDNILVNAIAPGLINTELIKNIPQKNKDKFLENIPLHRFGNPQDIADLVNFLASKKANYITGQVFNVNGGLYM